MTLRALQKRHCQAEERARVRNRMERGLWHYETMSRPEIYIPRFISLMPKIKNVSLKAET